MRQWYVLLVFLSPDEAVFTARFATLEATAASATDFRTARRGWIGLSWQGQPAIGDCYE